MIQDITLKFGSSSTQKNLKTDLTPITIFVGPNNSGKSKILNEIESYCKSGLENDNFLILDSVNFSQLNDTEDILNTHILNPRPSDNLGKEQVVFGDEKHRRPIAKTTIDSFLADRNSQKRMYCVYYVSLHTLRLGGESRIKLVEKKMQEI